MGTNFGKKKRMLRFRKNNYWFWAEIAILLISRNIHGPDAVFFSQPIMGRVGLLQATACHTIRSIIITTLSMSLQ